MDNGIHEETFNTWNDFHTYITDEKKNLYKYIYRGHANENWKLLPRFYRTRNHDIFSSNRQNILETHKENFKLAIRGKRGVHSPHIDDIEENELWALGQHYGLDTPLLDWTTSPFVAAFFALSEDFPKEEMSEYCVVYGLNTLSVEKKIKEPRAFDQRFEIIQPLSDENIRLVSQGGLFTHFQIGSEDVEKWISARFKDSSDQALLKMKIINSEKEIAIRSLNKMNINYLSLFPDLTGASRHCNMCLKYDNY